MVRRDVLSPWRRRRTVDFAGSVPERRRATAVRNIATPLDGRVTVRLAGRGAAGLELILRNRAGRRLRGSSGLASHHAVSVTACGQNRLQAAVRRVHPSAGSFRLVVTKP